MTFAPFTKQDALSIMRRFMGLKDRKFLNGGVVYRVRIVAIIPIKPEFKNEALRMLFNAFNSVKGYSAGEAAKYILAQPTDEFDVMLIATAVQNGGYSTFSLPITTFVSEGGETDYGFALEFM